MLPWEMLLLLGYHQLTPCSIFSRRLGARGGGGDERRHGDHRKKEKRGVVIHDVSSPSPSVGEADFISTMDTLVCGQTRTSEDVRHSQKDQVSTLQPGEPEPEHPWESNPQPSVTSGMLGHHHHHTTTSRFTHQSVSGR